VPISTSRSLTRLLPPSLFPLSTAQRCQPHDQARKKENKQLFRTAAGSNGLLRAARGGEQAPGVAQMVPKNAMVVPPSPPLPLALVLRTSNNTTLSRKGARNSEWTATSRGRPDRTALRAAGPGKAAAARSSSSCGGGEGEKQIDFEALKAPAC
jgi:hypothetical protein